MSDGREYTSPRIPANGMPAMAVGYTLLVEWVADDATSEAAPDPPAA